MIDIHQRQLNHIAERLKGLPQVIVDYTALAKAEAQQSASLALDHEWQANVRATWAGTEVSALDRPFGTRNLAALAGPQGPAIVHEKLWQRRVFNAAISDTGCPSVGGTPVAGGSGLVQLTE
jgi:hypothetical protein